MNFRNKCDALKCKQMYWNRCIMWCTSIILKYKQRNSITGKIRFFFFFFLSDFPLIWSHLPVTSFCPEGKAIKNYLRRPSWQWGRSSFLHHIISVNWSLTEAQRVAQGHFSTVVLNLWHFHTAFSLSVICTISQYVSHNSMRFTEGMLCLWCLCCVNLNQWKCCGF